MRKPIFIRTVLAILLLIFLGLAVSQAREQKQLQLHQSIQLKSKEVQLIELKDKYDELLNSNSKDKEEQLKKIRELEAELEAKRNTPSELQKVASDTFNALSGTRSASAQSSGSCESWISQAGIKDISNARELISRESGCNPNAVNPSSGACGVAQELPCGKSGCSIGNGACQVRWMNSYVLGRYGSWSNAVAFHSANNWY